MCHDGGRNCHYAVIEFTLFGIMHAEHRYLRYGTRPRNLIVGTATRFCDTGNDSEYGNHLNRLAVANKLDFVHLHGFELWVHDEPVRVLGMLQARVCCVWRLPSTRTSSLVSVEYTAVGTCLHCMSALIKCGATYMCHGGGALRGHNAICQWPDDGFRRSRCTDGLSRLWSAVSRRTGHAIEAGSAIAIARRGAGGRVAAVGGQRRRVRQPRILFSFPKIRGRRQGRHHRRVGGRGSSRQRPPCDPVLTPVH